MGMVSFSLCENIIKLYSFRKLEKCIQFCNWDLYCESSSKNLANEVLVILK